VTETPAVEAVEAAAFAMDAQPNTPTQSARNAYSRKPVHPEEISQTSALCRERVMRKTEAVSLTMCGAFAAPRQNSSF
jgi:hypothetical protein